MKLPLAYYGHPILRKKAQLVTSFDQKLLDLIENMKETLLACRGLGLSAPQVGASTSLFLTNIPEDETLLGVAPGVMRVYINPKIESVSDESWIEEEGCLSIPKLYGEVARPMNITLSAQDEHGVTRREQCSGWLAKVILHENDHLNGVLFIDRLAKRARKNIEKELEALRRKFTEHNNNLELINP